jgi:hypothetical protein
VAGRSARLWRDCADLFQYGKTKKPDEHLYQPTGRRGDAVTILQQLPEIVKGGPGEGATGRAPFLLRYGHIAGRKRGISAQNGKGDNDLRPNAGAPHLLILG